MDRLEHLRQTLPVNLSLLRPLGQNAELVLVDYNSKQNVSEYIRDHFMPDLESGLLRYFRTEEPKAFFSAHAKNISHRLGNGDLLYNLDADNFLVSGLFERLQEIFTSHPRTVVCNGFNRSAAGRLCFFKTDFLALGGYSEKLNGWGRADSDLVNRAEKHLGLARLPLLDFDSFIDHADDMRTANYDCSGLNLEFRDDIKFRSDFLRDLYHEFYRRSPVLAAMWLRNMFEVERAQDASLFVANVGHHWGKANLTFNFKEAIAL
jgi:predicted glycosyltransferase involved in capsule biosynthesis